MKTVNDKGQIAFFFPVYGLEHQSYIEKRIKYLGNSPYHIFCLWMQKDNKWDLPSERITVLSSKSIVQRLLSKIKKVILSLIYKKENILDLMIISPYGWKTKLKRTIDQYNITAFIIFYGVSAILIGETLKKWSISYSVYFEGSDSQMSDNNKWYKRQLLNIWNNAHQCIFISRFLYEQALIRGCPAVKSVISLNGLELPRTKPEYTLTKPIKITNIGNLFPVKGHKYLLEGFCHALRSNPEMILTIIGGGYLERKLKQLAQKLQIQNNVIFTGSLPWEEGNILLSESHLFILPSIKAEDGQEEGLGFSVIEAQSLGKPAIVSDTGGLPEVVEDKITGKIVPQKDSIAIGEAINELLSNSELLREMSTNAFNRAQLLFNLKRHGDDLKNYMENLLTL